VLGVHAGLPLQGAFRVSMLVGYRADYYPFSMGRADRQLCCMTARKNPTLGRAWFALFSLCLLLSGPGHVVFHGIAGSCHSNRGQVSFGHEVLGLSGSGASVLPLDSCCGGGLLSDHSVSLGGGSVSQIAIKPHSLDEEDCAHCMQNWEETPSGTPPLFGLLDSFVNVLSLDQRVHATLPLGVPSPRGPPTVA